MPNPVGPGGVGAGGGVYLTGTATMRGATFSGDTAEGGIGGNGGNGYPGFGGGPNGGYGGSGGNGGRADRAGAAHPPARPEPAARVWWGLPGRAARRGPGPGTAALVVQARAGLSPTTEI